MPPNIADHLGNDTLKKLHTLSETIGLHEHHTEEPRKNPTQKSEKSSADRPTALKAPVPENSPRVKVAPDVSSDAAGSVSTSRAQDEKLPVIPGDSGRASHLKSDGDGHE